MSGVHEPERGGSEMNLKKTLSNLNDVIIDDNFVQDIEKIYNSKLSETVKRILSLTKETSFYEDKPLLRGLSKSEILNADDDLSVGFQDMGLLPIFDIGDNDFIVYSISENLWCLFNIVDEIVFKNAKELSELL
jgi:hypothetical protein